MTTTYIDEPEPPSLRPLASVPPWRFSWAAVFAGAIISLGIWLLLHVLGLGAGLTAINPHDAGSLRGVGLGTGIWSLIVPLIAMFVGGFAAAKVAGPITRLGGAIHGAALWSLATIIGTLALFSLLSGLLGGVARVGQQAVGGMGKALGAAANGNLMGAAGISTDDLLAPVNERLKHQGMPAVSSEQLGSAVKDAMKTAVREGRVDREALTTSLARNTALSQGDARELAGPLEQRINQQASELGQKAEQAGTTALEAAESTGKGLLGLFFAMLLGLIAAVAGATVGPTRAQVAVAERATARADRLVGRHA
jgi:hypothetical protein